MTLGPYVHESAIKLSGIHSGKVLLPGDQEGDANSRGRYDVFSLSACL